LADFPAAFANSGDIIRWESGLEGSTYAMTNKGLRIELPLIPIDGQHRHYLTILNCRRSFHVDGILPVYW